MMFDCHYWSFLLSKLSCHNCTKTTSWTKPAWDNLWPALQPFSYILVVWTLTPGGLPHYSQLPLRSESKPCTSFPKTTVQLSCKVTFARIPDVSCMHFRRVSYTFWTRSTCVLDASPSDEKGAWCSLKALPRGFMLAQMCLVHIPPNLSYIHFRRVSHAFQMYPNVTLELSCAVAQRSWTPTIFFCHMSCIKE